MQPFANYYLVWFGYLAAGAVFYGIFWYFTRFPRARWLAYFMRAVMAAVIVTPWYAHSDEDILAPALMIAMLDAISGGGSATRALVPLFLALGAVLLSGGLLFVLRRSIWSKK
ncbi:MAG: hypothetical protein RL120_19275 [Gammaproteobacteria bacterium]